MNERERACVEQAASAIQDLRKYHQRCVGPELQSKLYALELSLSAILEVGEEPAPTYPLEVWEQSWGKQRGN